MELFTLTISTFSTLKCSRGCENVLLSGVFCVAALKMNQYVDTAFGNASQ